MTSVWYGLRGVVRGACLLLVSVLGWVTTRWAGTIAFVVENTTNVTERHVVSEFRLCHTGTDTAWDVSLQAMLLDQEHALPVSTRFEPGSTAVVKGTFELPPDAQGSFPLFAMLTYHDVTGKAFSNAVLAIARTAHALEAALRITATQNISVRGNPVRVELIAPVPSLRTATVTCHAPDDVAVTQRVRRVTLEQGKAVVEFPAAKRGGLPGSRHSVYLTAEYDHEGVH